MGSVLPGSFSLWWWVVFGFERIVRYPRRSSLVFVLFFCCNYQKSVKRIAGKNLNLSWMYHCGYWKNLPWLEQRRLNTKYSKFIFNENYCKNRCIALYPCRSGGRIYERIYLFFLYDFILKYNVLLLHKMNIYIMLSIPNRVKLLVILH